MTAVHHCVTPEEHVKTKCMDTSAYVLMGMQEPTVRQTWMTALETLV